MALDYANYNIQKDGRADRQTFLDFLKGVGIILVVIGHFIELFRADNRICDALFIAIYVFHMPLFVFISGHLQSFKLKKLKTITLYYLLAQITYLLVRIIFRGYEVTPYSIIRGVILPFWHLWYLYALAIWIITIPLLDLLLSKIHWIAVVIIALAISLGAGFFECPYDLQRIFAFFPFFCIGHICRIKKYKCSGNTVAMMCVKAAFIIIVLALAAILHSRINAEILFSCHSYRSGEYSVFDRLCFILLATGVVFCIFDLAQQLIKEVRINIFTILGKHTMPVFLWHGFAIWGLRILFRF